MILHVYPLGRAWAVNCMDESMLTKLHSFECNQMFLFPLYLIRKLVSNNIEPVGMVKDDGNLQQISDKIYSCMPDIKKFGLDTPTSCVMEFIHEWDKKIMHSGVGTLIRQYSETKGHTAKGLLGYSERGE